MTEPSAVRRHADGSIDFDYYRTRAVALRRQAMRDSATLRSASVGTLVMVGALGFAVAIPSTSEAVREQFVAAWSSLPLMR